MLSNKFEHLIARLAIIIASPVSAVQSRGVGPSPWHVRTTTPLDQKVRIPIARLRILIG